MPLPVVAPVLARRSSGPTAPRRQAGRPFGMGVARLSHTAAASITCGGSLDRTTAGGLTFGMGECTPAQLAGAAAVLREALHAGGYGSHVAQQLLRLHGGSKAEGIDDAAPPVVGIAEGGADNELCSTGWLGNVENRGFRQFALQRQVKRRAACCLGQPRPVSEPRCLPHSLLLRLRSHPALRDRSAPVSPPALSRLVRAPHSLRNSLCASRLIACTPAPLTPASRLYWLPTFFRLLEDAPQPSGVLLLLFLLGAAVRRATVESALGPATLALLREHGLLLHAGQDGCPGEDGPELLASPVQIYPVATRHGAAVGAATVGGAEATTEAGAGDCGGAGAGDGGDAGDAEDRGQYEDEELLVATDWARESLVPAKFAVMPIGDDSLNLVHLAPRCRCHRVLDLCTGSGVQALVAVRCYAEAAVATDVNPRALRFVTFNAALNGLAAQVTTRQGDGYAALTPRTAPTAPPQCSDYEPFDVILANPPFVAVPPPPPGASTHAEWALYADGGPDGGRVLDAIIAGASTTRLRPGGHLAIVSEFPNIRGAHLTLSALRPGLSLSLFYDPLHVQTAAEYAADRADERGWPWADAATHLSSLRAHGVDHMGSGVLFGVQCRGGAVAAGGGVAGGGVAGGGAAGNVAKARGGGGTSHPMDGSGGETENLVARAGLEIRRICQRMLLET